MIGVSTRTAHGEYDPGTSKFFGSPTMPEEWLESLADDEFYFAQIKLAELTPFDGKHLLPPSGFLYFFLAKEDGAFRADVRYFDGEPDVLIDDCNEGFDLGDDTLDDCSASFFAAPDAADGTALLRRDGDSLVLLQYDPLDENKPAFLSETEKVLVFRMAPEDLKTLDFSRVSVALEEPNYT